MNGNIQANLVKEVLNIPVQDKKFTKVVWCESSELNTNFILRKCCVYINQC